MMDPRIDALLIKNTRVDKTSATKRLFCFPWAGGCASYFLRLSKRFADDIEILALMLPGRERRLKDESYHSIEELADDVCQAILKEYTDKPFAFYGHSFGAIVCMEVVRRLQKHGHEPTHLFVSGAYVPESKTGMRMIRGTPPRGFTDDFLLEHMRKVGGTPPEILNDKSMQQIFLPPLRSDLSILWAHSYSVENSPPLSFDFDIVGMDGQDDLDHLWDEWRALTTANFSKKMFKGAHFFLLDTAQAKLLAEYISGILCGSRSRVH